MTDVAGGMNNPYFSVGGGKMPLFGDAGNAFGPQGGEGGQGGQGGHPFDLNQFLQPPTQQQSQQPLAQFTPGQPVGAQPTAPSDMPVLQSASHGPYGSPTNAPPQHGPYGSPTNAPGHGEQQNLLSLLSKLFGGQGKENF